MTNIKNSSGQRGVALLFALGILSLLLVMGVAFLGNALISQKIAINNQESASAKMLGRTAVDRLLSHLTMFHLAQAQSAGNFYAADGSSVFSRLSTGAFDNSSILTTKRDRIYTDKVPLFSVSRGKEGASAKQWYDGSQSLAEWIYVHEDGTFSDGQTAGSSKIVGRFAYQVLPQTSASRLSLFAVTSGASRVAGEGVSTDSAARIPQKHRWGLDVDELVIPNTMFSTYWKYDSGDNLCDPLHEFDNFINVLSGGQTNADHFYGDTAHTESRRRWLEHIFAEGRGRIAREAYWGGDGWYPRFNLSGFNYYWDGAKRVPVWSKTDTVSGKSVDSTWYQRFLDTVPGSEDAEKTAVNAIRNQKKVVDFLLRAPGKYTDGFLYDGQYEEPGLPFLSRIGNKSEKGGFEDIADLRRQIAANLNDYCDADSIPTSDVGADKWKDLVVKIDDLPKFTGNEQTPYINELAFGFKMSDGKITAESGKCDFEAKFTPEIIAELIRVYKSTPGISNTQLHGFIKSLGVTLKVSVSGTATGSYKKSVDGVETTVAVPQFSLTDLVIEGSDISYSELKNKKFDIPFDTSSGGPYWIKNFQFTDTQDVISVKASLYQKLRELSGTTDNEVNFTVNPTNIKVEVSKVLFNLGNLVLTATIDGKPEVGIDFVKFIDPPGDSEFFSLEPQKVKEYSSMTDLGKDWIFHVGVMQAIDPRQNLNAKFIRNGVAASSNVKESDWFFSVSPSLKFQDEKDWNWNAMDSRLSGTDVNVCSKPNAPCLADTPGAIAIDDQDRDIEKAEDPAWRGDKDDEHISTAVIRNAPMLSPWELGFIHRGIPFQTINLLKAGSIEYENKNDEEDVLDEDAHKPGSFANASQNKGTLYKFGDAGILDQIKMTDLTKSYGKVDISALQNPPVNWVSDGVNFETLKLELFKALFENLFPDGKTYQAVHFVDKVYDRAKAPDFTGITSIVGQSPTVDAVSKEVTVLRSKALTCTEALRTQFEGKTTDAAREEVIGKTINLIEGRGSSLPNVFKVIVAAQAIRDLSGPITKLDSSGNPQTATAADGRFDALISGSGAGSDLDSSIYYDDILGECRMLVTIEKLHYFDSDVPRARLRVKQIEYLD